MAAIIQLRRGSSPSSLSYGEPFINDDSASLVIGLSGSGDIITLAKLEQKNHGNIWIDGDITASSISASGDIRIGGQLFLGDEASDNIVVQGSLSSSLIPEADGTYDLGSSTKKWKDIHVGTIFATSTVVTGQANISGSAQITAFGFISGSDLNSLNSYTASNDVAIGLINTHTASANIKFTNIESTTSSFDGRLDNIEAATGSYINTATLNSLGVISGSSQVDADSVTNFDNNVDTRIDAKGVLSGSAQVVSSFPTGVISGSSQVNANSVTNFDTNVDTRLDAKTVISGSSQVDGTAISNNSITISGTAVSLGGTITDEVLFGGVGVLSGSGQIPAVLPTGVISGSSQVDAATVSNFDSNVDDRLNAKTVVSGSSQVVGILNEVNTFTSSNDNTSLNSFTSSFDTAITLDSSNVTVLGNLTVQGTQTALDTNTLNVADLNILVASGAADSSAANGAGLTVDGANKSIVWNHADQNFRFNTDVSASVFKGDGSGLTGLTADSVAYANITGLPTLVSGSGQTLAHITGSDLDMNGNKVLFANVYAAEGDLPSAVTYHGMFAHVHATGRGYFAHAGAWIPLVNLSDGVFSGSSQVNADSVTNFDANVDTRLDAKTVISGSSQVNADSITNFDTNVDTRLDAKTVISGSSQVNADSVTNFDSNVDTRLDAKTVISGSSQVVLDDADKTGFNTDEVTEGSTNKYASTTNVKTALNANLGTATIGDSDDTITIPGNLNVGGETNYTSTNNITIGDNIIELNYGGSATTSGILTKDATGGSTISGSLLWDATNDYWKAGKLGSESELITDGTLVSKLPDGLVSGSSQVDATAVANFDANVDTRLDAKTVISGSSQVNYNQILNQPNTISNAQSTKLGYITVSQAVDLDTMESNITTNNSKVGYTDALVKLKLDADGVISGSSQVNANSITNFDTNVDTRLDAKTVISGSSQVNANSITNFDANVDTRLDAKTVISGSSQVDGASITNKSVSFGGVSVNLGSSDATPAFDLSDATAYPGDSSLTTLGTVTSGNVTAILPTGVISGSSQQTFESSSFAETASLAIHTAEWILGASGASHYTFTGPGHLTGSSDPAIYLTRGQKYRFTNKAGSHPFRIQSTANGSAGTQYNNGVTNQDAGNNETLEFDVPMNAPNTLYYQCTIHGSMGGPIYIADAADYLTAESDTLATVTGRGATTSTAIEFSNTTNSTSKTTGAVKIGGGLGVADNINAGGDIVAYASSDERLKDNIKPIEGALDKVSQISGNTFDWNEEKQNIYKGKDYGVIAQEIEKVMPELVDTRDDGYKAVKYEKIVPLLIESIKELQKEINELKSK